MSETILLKDNFPLISKVNSHKAQKKAFKGVVYDRMDDGYGNPILRKVGENTVVLGGAITALERLTGKVANFEVRTINNELNIQSEYDTTESRNLAATICLFGVGINGASNTYGDINATDIKNANVDGGLTPIRYNNSITTDAGKYFMKKEISGKNAYFLKRFAEDPTIRSFWKDTNNTEITSDVYDSTSETGIETFAEFSINMNIYDVREYFEEMPGQSVANARFNCLALFTGYYDNSLNEYTNVRLFSYINFNNRPLDIAATSSFVYRIYSLS